VDDSRRERIGLLLEEAAARPVNDRQRFLDEACGTDLALREELASLLTAFDASSGYFETLQERVVAPLLSGVASSDREGFVKGQTVSHFAIDERIGSGGMGVVYKARDLRLGRTVALKVLPPELSLDDAARARLVAEARAASALDHPNIGVVHEIGETDAATLFLVMGWYDGETLKQKLQRGRLSISETVALGDQIAGALGAAHAVGIVHRDVKPSNILITNEGVAKLLDFGIAKVAGTALTKEGSTLGTVAYMSPEQTRGQTVDGRSDLWGLGTVLYEAVTGRRPFLGEDDQAVIYAIRHDEPEPISRLRSDATASLGNAIAGCLAKDLTRRFAKADELRAALQAGESAPPPAHRQLRKRSARYRQIAVAFGVVGLLAIGGYALVIRRVAPDPADSRVVVVPFENRTGQASLDPIGTMAADWVIQGLSRTGTIEVVPITTSLAASRFVRTAASRDTGDRIRLLAEEAGAGIVVSGAYYQQADSVYLRATVTDARRNRVVNALEPVGAPSARPLVAVELIRQRLMSVLNLRLNPRIKDSPGVLAVTPPTYDAYLEVTEGFDRFFARDWRGAITHFAEALARDSTYTIPLVMNAMAFLNLGNFAAVDSIVAIARPRLPQMTEGERIALESAAANAKGDYAAAYNVQLRIPQVAPGGIAHWGFGNSALDVNRPDEAVRELRKLDPERGELRGWLFYWLDLTVAHHRLGDHSTELRVARRTRGLFPNAPQASGVELRALAALGRADEVQALVQGQAQKGVPLAPLQRQAGLELLAHGFTAAGTAMLRASLDRSRTLSLDNVNARLFRADAYVLMGERDEAERLIRGIVAERPDLMAAHGLVGTLAARRGDSVEAARVSNWLAALRRPHIRGANTYWRARIAAQLGDKEGAVRLLRQAFTEGALIWDSMHTELDFAGLRDFPPFRELLRPKG
jgi:TolB-like protein/tetratricopeptide (TPR) repeat protein